MLCAVPRGSCTRMMTGSFGPFTQVSVRFVPREKRLHSPLSRLLLPFLSSSPATNLALNSNSTLFVLFFFSLLSLSASIYPIVLIYLPSVFPSVTLHIPWTLIHRTLTFPFLPSLLFHSVCVRVFLASFYPYDRISFPSLPLLPHIDRSVKT